MDAKKNYDTVVELLDFEEFIDFAHTGSRAIMENPPEDSDDDYVMLIGKGDMNDAIELLKERGFEASCNECLHYPTEFTSYRRGLLNLILTEAEWFYERFVIATDVAAILKLEKREDRVKLFKLLREIGRD